MARFTPTPEQRRKYSHYTAEVHESVNKVYFQDTDEGLARFIVTIARIPSTKKFIVYTRIGCSTEDKMFAERLALALPHGEWARVPEHWFKRRRASGPGYKYLQTRGGVVGDPLIQLELEMLIDADRSQAHVGLATSAT